jgi:hypothetical protein
MRGPVTIGPMGRTREHDATPDAVRGDRAPAPAGRASLGSREWASAVGNRAVQRLARQRRMLARLTPAEILDQYQVDEDRTAVWRPKFGGKVTIPFSDSRRLTVTEGTLLDRLTFDRGLVGLSTFKDIADEAFTVSTREFPSPPSVPAYVPTGGEVNWRNNDGHRDAFRHCYWNARLVKEFNYNWTRQFTTAHEALPGNTATREAMDLYNNEVGRNIARDNPEASDEELARLVRKAVDEGRLIVVNQAGDLAWSNAVPLWQHGIAPETARPGAIRVPAGDATAS